MTLRTVEEHTERMLGFFETHGIDRYDLGLRFADGRFVARAQQGLGLEEVRGRMLWLRYENCRGTEVYIRPARRHDWPVAFFDDVDLGVCRRAIVCYEALCVRTSRIGGAHLWLVLSRKLDERQRAELQRCLAPRLGADPASTDGAHFGRLAGMRNHKRGGEWVGVLFDRNRYDPSPLLSSPPMGGRVVSASSPEVASKRARDESVAELAWCCHRLREGRDSAWIEHQLCRRAIGRGKRNAAAYAARTVEAARTRLWETRR